MTTYILSLFLSFGLLNSTQLASTGYTYIDGNNNAYFLCGKELKYEPISRENSSSGEYDGGEKRNLQLSKTQTKKLTGLFKEAIANKADQIENRNMGCGTLKYVKKSGDETYYLAMNSDSKKAIETYLSELFGKA